jgi:DNA-binding LytR/AlgR family response regulator
MNRILLLEDEKAAAIRLTELVEEVAPEARVMETLESVRDAIEWFSKKPTTEWPDLILSDIQLADGVSLDIFKQVNINVPIIFTTAYDAYTLRAFKLNSIDYLLKPIDKDELRTAFGKFRSLRPGDDGLSKKMLDLIQNLASGKPGYKSRFLLRLGERYITIPADEVGYIRADDKVVFLHTAKGQKHIIDDSLDDLEATLDPSAFFRINRTYITPLASIEKIHNHFNGRLKINLHHSDDNEIFVSRARAIAFKKWLGK